MLKAREVLEEARRRDRSMIPVMVIITDGNTNIPLKRSLQTGENRTFNPLDAAFFKYEDLAVEDVISVSETIRKEGINTVVINTNPVLAGWQASGLLVTQMIAKITNGSHHEVGRISNSEELVHEMSDLITKDERVIAHKSSSK
jgi:Mg-chelatase subunit ChlD